MEELEKKEIIRRTKFIAQKFQNNIMDMSWKEIDKEVEWILERVHSRHLQANK